MRVYKIVGIKSFSGTSKNGNPFVMTKLQMTYEDPTDKSLTGCGVHEENVFDRVIRSSGYQPVIGDKVQLFFEPDFNGFARLAHIQPVK